MEYLRLTGFALLVIAAIAICVFLFVVMASYLPVT